jgi:hypothetical protein
MDFDYLFEINVITATSGGTIKRKGEPVAPNPPATNKLRPFSPA